MQKRTLTVAVTAMSVGLAAVVSTGTAMATHGPTGSGHAHQHGSAGAGAAGAVDSSGRALSFAADLSGANEVPVPGGPAVNDPDARAAALVKVKGDRVTFALRWKGFTPSLGHIHEGAAGRNGEVRVPLFGTEMPDTVHSAAGQVSVTDPALAQSIRTNASSFYVNLHSKEFPGGAVRGQLKPLARNVNPLEVIKGGSLRAFSSGSQEVPKDETSKVGDPDGFAVSFLRPRGTSVDYSLAWVNIQSPSKGHIHKGRFGENGDVVFDLLNRPVPEGIFAISGRLEGQNPDVVKRVRQNPQNYYSNIHTSEFPDGAVRGQFFN
ncbi:CHRD domain-containing protein [Streptomyces zhihengii]|uniref:CHRD domain-containing protein n=1 Tax=Streptomyces zhihengii TaxID=1818004 RepID=A0ABS2V3X2_9ACTN|nr:CHRD domain-containing protein [Streptomyces zhihengii]MBM9624532.1 CHRD domain-containing protein [Streptomyces zhihengii]